MLEKLKLVQFVFKKKLEQLVLENKKTSVTCVKTKKILV